MTNAELIQTAGLVIVGIGLVTAIAVFVVKKLLPLPPACSKCNKIISTGYTTCRQCSRRRSSSFWNEL